MLLVMSFTTVEGEGDPQCSEEDLRLHMEKMYQVGTYIFFNFFAKKDDVEIHFSLSLL